MICLRKGGGVGEAGLHAVYLGDATVGLTARAGVARWGSCASRGVHVATGRACAIVIPPCVNQRFRGPLCTALKRGW